MQENRCDKAPVLSLDDQVIVLGPVGDQDIGEGIVVLDVDRVVHHIGDDVVKAVRPCRQRYVVGSETPHSDCGNSNNPGSPGDTCEPMYAAMPAQGCLVANLC